jgi:serine/threonine protein kinase
MPDKTDSPSVGPTLLGDFEIVRELGRGGMGIVYEARQASLNRQVALKILSATLGLNPRAVQRFHLEAEAAAKLHHSNIVPVYATGEHNGTHFYAMELIQGPSLDHVIKEMRRQSAAAPASPQSQEPPAPDLANTGPYIETTTSPLTEGQSSSLGSGGGYFDRVARMIADVADALEHAHNKGVIHRDIKPSNLLLSPDGRLSINDFGLARMLEQPGLTMTGEFLGTPAYMAPEQIAAGRVPVDHRIDIYSLGATLYELLTLRAPFTGERRDQVLAQIMSKEPRPPRKLNKAVPRDLETICLKALDKDPDKRYQTAGALAEDLRRFVNRFAISAKRAGPIERTRKWVRRHPGLSAALAVAVFALLAAGFFAYQARDARRRHRAEQCRNAVEKAHLKAMSGDFEGAEEAVHEAERAGVSAGQVRMLRGLLAYYSGKTRESLEHFQQAVELLPDSVAARSMLAVASYVNGRPGDLEKNLAVAEALSPTSPEDYLFRGYAEAQSEPALGLKSLNEAVRRRPRSALFRLIRAEVRMNLATDLGSAAQAEEAVRDAEAAREMLPDNPFPLWIILSSRVATANAHALAGNQHLRARAIARGRQDAKALVRFSHNPEALTARWEFLRLVGEANTLEQELRRTAERTGNSLINNSFGLLLYRQGEAARASAVFAKHRGNAVCDLLRCFALAELPGGTDRARALCQEMATRDLRDWDLFNNHLLQRCFVGRDAAQAASKRFLAQPDRFPPLRRAFFRRSVEYLAGELSLAEYQKSLGNSQWDRCSGYFTIGVTLLAKDRQAAKRYFDLCVKTGVFTYLPFDLAWVFHKRMEDPAWPPWLPAKE